MKKVVIFSVLLISGLVLSQFLPALAGNAYGPLEHVIRMLTMMALAFIMINVGREFEIDKNRLGMYGWDYVVAMTTAAFLWIFVTLYFVFAMLPVEFWTYVNTWKESLALAIGMWPRGDVGAGVLVVSLSYGIGGPILTAAMLSLCLNLVLTGVFIMIAKWLLKTSMADAPGEPLPTGRHAHG